MEFGTPLFSNSRKILLLGSGELGKEMAIEAQRMGVEVIAVDRYDMAPAMHVAHRKYVVDMLDGEALRAIVKRERPDAIIAEIEAINTDALVDIEAEGYRVIPNSNAVRICMNRLELRSLAAEKLKLPTTKYGFANSVDEVRSICKDIGYPCIIKPEMSSSGHGHIVVSNPQEIEKAYEYSIAHARGKGGRVVVEEFINIDLELTVLTYRYFDNEKIVTSTIPPIEHKRPKGVYHYIESWHPHTINEDTVSKAREYATKIVNSLGGVGIFGVELIVSNGKLYFNEVAPRPHDTGLVTLASCDINEFQIHIRSALGLPTPRVKIVSPAAAHVILAPRRGWAPTYLNISKALNIPGVQVRLFGKPFSYEHRRMGVVLATGETVEEARQKVREAASLIIVD